MLSLSDGNQRERRATGVVRLPADFQEPLAGASSSALGVGQLREALRENRCVKTETLQALNLGGHSLAESVLGFHTRCSLSEDSSHPMTDFKQRFDIFICGGSQHVDLLQPLLEQLLPYGTVHLASSFLREDDVGRLQGRCDVLHRPAHSRDGYANFELFCIKDLYRLATAQYFIKLDADVTLSNDWFDYVEACIAAHPHAVLMGPWKGDVEINVELSGPPIRRRLHRDVRVEDSPKVIGGFCVARTAFFKQRLWLLDLIHEGVLSGRRTSCRAERETITVRGRVGKRGSPCSEDTLRSLLVHAVGASHRLRVIDSGGRIRVNRDGSHVAPAR